MLNFFRDTGVRETIESILIAIMLALMFKAFEAEAYIIPTGSMAPTLRGEHFDVACEQCGQRFITNCRSNRTDVRSVYCPICRYRTVLAPERLSDHNSFEGDRILVNKFIYDFDEPKRWDVIVFKNPKNAKQNYIKRLCGLPGESLLIERGDIYTFDAGIQSFDQRQIARKPPSKVRTMMQMVDDTQHRGKKLLAAGWPSRWMDSQGNGGWQIPTEPTKSFEIDSSAAAEIRWLRYRHLQPQLEDWESLFEESLPPRVEKLLQSGINGAGLVRDHYSYNEFGMRAEISISGFHWVGDLGVEAWIEVESDQGSVIFETTEGGVQFRANIDIATGQVTLSASGTGVQFTSAAGTIEQPSGTCAIRGSGSYRVLWMNADDRLFLWVNDRVVTFGNSPYQDYQRSGPVLPSYSDEEPGDALPLGIGVYDASLKVSRIKVWRDVYYTSQPGETDYRINLDAHSLNEVLDNPRAWNTATAIALFDSLQRSESDLWPLEDGQYFPMGDNSPSSQDARAWGNPPYVSRDLLLGRGLFLYWPHSWNSPIFGFPDFARMKFIR